MIGFYILSAVLGLLVLNFLYALIFWRTYDETWAWIHQRNRLTGDERHIQKVRGVPMVPPPRPEGSPPPPAPSR